MSLLNKLKTIENLEQFELVIIKSCNVAQMLDLE